MIIQKVIEKITRDEYKSVLLNLYGNSAYSRQKDRYLSLLQKFSDKFTEEEITIISSPGRTELGGNHTDHNQGRVLAASIQLDTLGIVAKSGNKIATVYSEGFQGSFSVDLDKLDVKSETEDSTSSLLRGIISIFKTQGLVIGGFNAFLTSDVLIGSGLSSSASIEVFLGKILSVLFNKDSVDSVDLAKIGQKAENIFLEKPCGLMDQVACAHGGIVAIDFKDPSAPVIDRITYSFEENGFNLLVVDTGGDHADMTADYASIPAEMKSVASIFGEEVCRFVNKDEFFKKIPEIAASLGDRPVLRALHFFNEDDRVVEMVDFLKANNLDSYLKKVRQSGDSSFKFLQNVFTTKYISDQKISLAIALAESYANFTGAVRVHGGGFAGTVQIYIQNDQFDHFKKYMERFFGLGSVTRLKIRNQGSIVVL